MRSKGRYQRKQRRADQRKADANKRRERAGKVRPSSGPLDRVWRRIERLPVALWMVLVLSLFVLFYSLLNDDNPNVPVHAPASTRVAGLTSPPMDTG